MCVSRQLSVLEANVSLIGDKWQKYPTVTGPEALCILSADYLRRRFPQRPKRVLVDFGVATVDAERIKRLYTFLSLLEDPSGVGLLWVEEQQVPIAAVTVH